MCVSVCVPHFPVDWRLLVEECIANIGIPLEVLRFLSYTVGWFVKTQIPKEIAKRKKNVDTLRHISSSLFLNNKRVCNAVLGAETTTFLQLIFPRPYHITLACIALCFYSLTRKL